MLKYRLIFGLLFAALVVGVFFLDARLAGNWRLAPPGAVVAFALLLLIPLALREMQGLLANQHVLISMRICVVAAALCVIWPWLDQVSETLKPAPAAAHAATLSASHPVGPAWSLISHWFRTVKPHYLVPTVMAGALVAAFLMHTRRHRIEGAMANAGATLLAIVYLGVLPGFFLPICLTHGSWMVLGIIAIVKAADIGAYITGRLLGRHKLIYWLSPGKTVEGLLGGLAFAAVAGILVAAATHGFRWWQGALAGVILGAVGQLGDLMESLLKRDAGVKDSGRVPGFGGVLDLIDSPLLAAPVAYWILKLLALKPLGPTP